MITAHFRLICSIRMGNDMMQAAIVCNSKEWPLLGSAASEVDQQDIGLCLQGDEDAYARLIKRYEAQIVAQMWRFTRDPLLLDELVQEVFVEAYQSLNGYKGSAPFIHWLRRIAVRVGYRFWKHKARETDRRETLHQHQDEFIRSHAPKTPSEAGEMVHQILEKLPPKERLVLTLLYFEQWDTQEIADHIGWSRSLVRCGRFGHGKS